MNSKALSPEMMAELAALEAMSDEEIDTSDIGELTDEEYDDPARIRYRGAHNRPISLLLDSRVAHWFRSHAVEGSPVEETINRILLNYVDEQERRAG